MRKDTWMRNFFLRCLFGTAAMLGASFAQGGLYDGWGYQAPLTFTGYGQSETLTNFPALVVLSNNCFRGSYAFSYGQFQSGSNDLAFTDSTGLTNLNYEIDTWNPNGTSYVWVQVPALASNTTVIAWWGAAGQTAQACTTNGSVWSSGYAAVWHMGETNAADWTANRRSCTSSGTAAASGVVGGAQGFNGASFMDTPTNLVGYGVTTGFTVSCWFRSNKSADQCLMEDGNAYWDDGLYLFCIPNTSRMCAAVFNGNGSYVGYDSISVPAMGTAWHNAVHTYDGATEELLYDGVSVWKSSAALGNVRAAGQRLHFGYRISGGNYLSGAMDEIRIANAAQSSNWLWACYQNMAANASFQSYGTVTTSSESPAIQNVAATNVTQTSACPNGLLATDGSSAASVTLYWGPADGETNATAWANAAVFGTNAQPTPTAYTTNLTGLASGTTYYYRYFAANDSGGSWASPSLSFTTMGVPVVDNAGGATKVFSSTATLNGTVISGIPAPSVYICWGTADGGSTATDAWQNAVALGVQSGAFSTSLSGLMPGTAYYYRCYATNSEGAAWASASVSFTTASWTLNGNTLSDGNWSLTVSASGDGYTVSGYTSGSGDLDLRNTGFTITGVGYQAFCGNTRIVSVELPDTVTILGEQSFFTCTSLTSVKLSSALQTIGWQAFQNCMALTNVVPLLPGGVTYLGSCAFASCPITGDLALTNAGPVTVSGNSHFWGTKIASATLGKGVTSVSYEMFYNCPKLGFVSISDNVTVIADQAFQNCASLTNVVPLLPGGVTYLGSCAFASCPITGDLAITNAGPVTLSGNSHFWGTKIASAMLGKGVTSVPYQMFYSCPNLGSVSMSDNVTSFGEKAFYTCTSLTNMVPLLPSGVILIGNCAFSFCPIAGDLAIANAGPVTLSGTCHFWETKIASATLGNGVTNLPNQMFAYCANLQRVYFGGCPTLGGNLFQNTANYQMRTYIPKGNADWQAVAATQVAALSENEKVSFQTAYPGEKLPLGTWVPPGAGTAWYCIWVPPQDQHKGTLIYLK